MINENTKKSKGLRKKPQGFGKATTNNSQDPSLKGYTLTRRHICKINPDGTFTPLVTFDFTDGSITFWEGGDHE